MRQGEMQRFAEQLLALALDCPVLAEPVRAPADRSVAEATGKYEDELDPVAVLSNN